eukprot:SAG22_NODE_1192_length_5204_cov_12.812929_1_plen_72_part_10
MPSCHVSTPPQLASRCPIFHRVSGAPGAAAAGGQGVRSYAALAEVAKVCPFMQRQPEASPPPPPAAAAPGAP